ncbi:MAG: hypothetical protein U0073_04365 [Bacteroidia bacterium]
MKRNLRLFLFSVSILLMIENGLVQAGTPTEPSSVSVSSKSGTDKDNLPLLRLNPLYQTLQVQFSEVKDEKILLVLYSTSGRIVRTESFDCSGRDASVHLTVGDLSPAIYILKTKVGKDEFVQKVILRQ